MIRVSFKALSIGLIAFASMLAAPLAANASNLTYTATGGLITGTLNGTPFTDATWSITGTADPTTVVSGTYFGVAPGNFLAMAPMLTIGTGSSTLQATLVTSGSTGEQVGVFSMDFNAFLTGVSVDVFGYVYGDGSASVFGMGVEGSGLYFDLQSPFSGTGAQNGGIDGTYYTDIGLLNITSHNSQVATFTVSGGSPSAVPEIDPNSLGSVLALVLGSLGLLERRRLKAA
jgi:hypothetical protein